MRHDKFRCEVRCDCAWDEASMEENLSRGLKLMPTWRVRALPGWQILPPTQFHRVHNPRRKACMVIYYGDANILSFLCDLCRPARVLGIRVDVVRSFVREGNKVCCGGKEVAPTGFRIPQRGRPDKRMFSGVPLKP